MPNKLGAASAFRSKTVRLLSVDGAPVSRSAEGPGVGVYDPDQNSITSLP